MEVMKMMNALPDSVFSSLPLLALPDLTEEGDINSCGILRI